MNALPKDVYEAATIDGATKFQAPVQINAPDAEAGSVDADHFASIDALKAFDFIYTMTKRRPWRRNANFAILHLSKRLPLV